MRSLLALGLIALATLLTASPTPQALPPPVQCVNGRPVGVGTRLIPLKNLPTEFTIQATRYNFTGGTLPIATPNDQGTAAVKLGNANDQAQPFRLSNARLISSDGRKVYMMREPKYIPVGLFESTYIDPDTGDKVLHFFAQYTCNPEDQTPVLTLVPQINQFIYAEITPNAQLLLTSDFKHPDRLNLKVIGGTNL